MDLIDRLKQIAERISKLKEQVQTEEATKTAFILPFIQALGYDVFNPLEVIPEFIADVGIKKGEKVDYCIMKEGEPVILMECKHHTRKLDIHKSQLHRYFHVTNARFAILTNGVKYLFYTDLNKRNVMDSKPFLDFNIQDLNEKATSAIKQFHKDSFDEDTILGSASELKYQKEIKELLRQELNSPSEDFVKYFVQKVYDGRLTSKVIKGFTELVHESTKTLINEMVTKRLQFAIDNEEEDQNDDGIVTTEEELKAFRIVQAILAKHVSLDRIVYRDKKSYFGVLFDDNNRKPICRLHLNGNTKYIELFDEKKDASRFVLESLNDIYKYDKILLDTVCMYDGSISLTEEKGSEQREVEEG